MAREDNRAGRYVASRACALLVGVALSVAFPYVRDFMMNDIKRGNARKKEVANLKYLITQCRTKAAGSDGILTEEESRQMASSFGITTSWRERADIGWHYCGDGPGIGLYVGCKNSGGAEYPYRKIPVSKIQMEKYLREAPGPNEPRGEEEK